MKSLYYRDSQSGKENPRLDEMLMACASVQVTGDVIGEKCVNSLKRRICRLMPMTACRS